MLILALAAGSPAGAANAKRTKTVTYLVKLKVDGRTVVGPFAATETVTGELLANPYGTGPSGPTSWTAEGTLEFGQIAISGLPQGCTLTTTAPTGTWKVSLIKSGGSLEVNWSSNTNQASASTLVCQGRAAPFGGAPSVQPFALLEPKEFSISEAGGSKQLSGKLSTGTGMMENIGTITITKREECEPKVKQVNTYPPGQKTQLADMVGKGFSPGEKLTADTNVELVLADGSVVRLAKGSALKEDDKCGAFTDTSRSFKGTLLLGKAWFYVTKVFGGQKAFELDAGKERFVNGVRGTTFWTSVSRTTATLSVGRGSVWTSRMSRTGKLVGRKFIVNAGWTAVMTNKGKITLRRTRRSDGFQFAKR